MKKILYIAMFSCQNATFWIEKQLHYKVSFLTSLRLSLHVSMCEVCKTYQQQSKQIDQILSRNLTENGIDMLENEPLKEKIIARLQDNNEIN